MIKLLVITTLYPNCENPQHGIFVETRLKHLLAAGQTQAVVIAPVPWFPLRSRQFGRYARFRAIPATEVRNTVTVYYPRYLVIPKIGMLITPFTLGLCIYRAAKKLRKAEFNFDLIDSHYFYPDGVATALACRWLNKPFVVTARGSDINLIANFRLPRALIKWAAEKSAKAITVSVALKRKMMEIGVDEAHIQVMRNGVDLDFFRPLDRDQCRAKYQLSRTTLLCVGNLAPVKGHELVLRAMQQLPEFDLLIIGDGELRDHLRQIVDSLDISDRVRFLGALDQQELVSAYNAGDITVLASSREGMANVILESLACGTPVVATDTGGARELISRPEAGILIERTVQSLVDGIRTVQKNPPGRIKTRQHAELFSWQDTINRLSRLFSALITPSKSEA